MYILFIAIPPYHVSNQHRGKPHGTTPATPPGMRITYQDGSAGFTPHRHPIIGAFHRTDEKFFPI
jgi:hypothetical protein